ncbi:unnamed protein product [Owenia fusiformis]|uniref:Uncharacterized protein n=1 Tax=Owenia fusiformis TaxID=6347 RepID=A0A8J1U721_OWEFU|nr:unnamed protein product [Owenia fusiformis]
MKQALCAVISVLLVSQCVALTPYYLKQHKNNAHVFTQLVKVPSRPQSGLDLCPTCIQFGDNALNALLNIILNSGVVGSCSALCSLLEQETGSKALGVVCTLFCDVEGIKEFIKIINRADLDPIYYCQLLRACPINDNGDAKITSLTVDPPSGPQGTFNIRLVWATNNGTGTGQVILQVETQDGLPVEGAFLNEAKLAGNYELNIQLKAQPDPGCDPSQGPCEKWEPGTYPVQVAVCNGECGSKHPHSKVFDQGSTNFTITPEGMRWRRFT